jgi:hypothetical protein
MAKKSESKKTKPKSAGLMTEVAVENLAFTLGRKADIDEVLRQAGLTRQRLSVLMVDDEIAQAMETRLDAVLNAPWRFVEDHGANGFFKGYSLAGMLRSSQVHGKLALTVIRLWRLTMHLPVIVNLL